MSGEYGGELLEAEYAQMVLAPEVRPAIACIKQPVVDEDGYVTHHEIVELPVAVHTLQVGRNGWVCEQENGAVSVVPYESVRFIDGEEG